MLNKKTLYPNLSKLTIIIVTYNRKNFILRTMNYWSGSNLNLVVVDGSKCPIDENVLKKFSKNISYYHRPISVQQRMIFATSLVNTEFALLGGDDEFFVPSALNSCIEKLIKNDELVSCIGRAMKFSFKKKQTIGRLVYPLLKNHKLIDEDPMIRIKKHFSNYIPRHCYSICRSNYWKIAWSEAYFKEYNFLGAPEKYFEFLITFSNKSVSIPELMWLRSDENIPIRGVSPSSILGYEISDWWDDNKYKKDKMEFINRIEKNCKEISKLNKKEYQPDVTLGYEVLVNFFKKDFRKLFKKGLFASYLNFLHSVFKKLPNIFKTPVKLIFRNFGFKPLQLNELPFFDQLTVLEKDGVKINYDELKNIEKIVRLFHLNK